MTEMNRLVVVTGANSGIGLATARELARRGDTVILACRSAERGEAARQELLADAGDASLRVMTVDLASATSVRAFAADVLREYDRLDVLVNNAGIFCPTRQLTDDGLERTLATNHLGPLLLTLLLLPLLVAAPQGRIINVSSAAAWEGKLDLEDLQMTGRWGRRGFDAYARSKLAQVYCSRELAKQLEGTAVTVNALHPGHVATNIYPEQGWLWRLVRRVLERFARSAEEAGAMCADLACAEEFAGVSGEFFEDGEPVDLPAVARDAGLQAQIWQRSLALVGYDPADLRGIRPG